MFSAEMTYVVINPYWHVPPGIARNPAGITIISGHHGASMSRKIVRACRAVLALVLFPAGGGALTSRLRGALANRSFHNGGAVCTVVARIDRDRDFTGDTVEGPHHLD